MVEFCSKLIIGTREIGDGCPVYIVAEAGVAHLGSLKKAYKLVDIASDAKADAIKFQVFKTEALISKESDEWFNRYKSRELPYESILKIKKYCSDKGITFLATAHDEPSLEFLSKISVPAYKIGSGEVENWQFIKKIASKNKPVILSTGMYTLHQIEEAIEIVTSTGNKEIALLHCTTQYPVPPNEVNLFAIKKLKEKFNIVIGYSDHTKGFHFPIAAVVCGAKVIEKHISIDFNIPDAQDWKVSCNAQELKIMIQEIREIESGFGNGEIDITENEKDSIKWARKSLVTRNALNAGDVLTSKMITTKRPGIGISPSKLYEVLGKRVKCSLNADTIIKSEHLE
jgi:N,N'-diacetyllegionaminate synthase